MANTITVDIQANSNLERVLKDVMQSTRGATNGLTGTIVKANLLTSAIQTGIVGALNLAVGAAQSLGNALAEAADLQLQTVSLSGNIAALTGMAFKDAEGFVQDLNKEMAEVAGRLPGATQDYVNLANGITDNLIPAFRDASGAVDTDALYDGLVEVTEAMGFLTSTSRATAQDTSKFVTKFMGGASIAELSRLVFAEENPSFLSFVESNLAELGKDLEDLTAKEKKDLLLKVSGILVTDDVLNAAKDTVSGYIEGIRSFLFDPNSGMFGLLRDLDEETKGNQSVLDAINENLKTLFGEDGIFPNLSLVLKEFGVSIEDPMLTLRKMFMGFNNALKWVNGVLQSILGEDFGEEYAPNLSVSEMVNQKLGKIKDTFTNFFTNLLDFDFPAINLIDAGSAVAKLQNKYRAIILDVVQNTDWGDLGYRVGYLVSDIVHSTLESVRSFIWGFIKDTNWLDVNRLVTTTILAFDEFVIGLILGGFKRGGEQIESDLGVLWRAIKKAFEAIRKGFVDMLGRVPELIRGTIRGVRTVTAPVSNVVSAATSTNPVTEAVSNVVDAVTGRSEDNNTTTTPAPNTSSGSDTGNAFMGLNVPSLLGAAARELNFAPSGAGLIMANDSEMILNQSQQQMLGGLISQAKAQISKTANSIPSNINLGGINISGVSDPEQVANLVIQRIDGYFAKMSTSQLMAPV